MHDQFGRPVAEMQSIGGAPPPVAAPVKISETKLASYRHLPLAEPSAERDVTLSFRDLSYSVVVDKKTGERKDLLKGISGNCLPGRLVGVVGRSGAGKSTLLDSLAGRVNIASLKGDILVNNVKLDQDYMTSFKKKSGYVQQEDALFPLFTVRENILFSAKLRMPPSVPLAEKEAIVDRLIERLGLQDAANTIIGNEAVRGVSGGEKRRASIGVDIVNEPQVMFLDEPTSGLDSQSALEVVYDLHKLARMDRRTVVLTIHQPSTRILGLIDDLIILQKGSLIYNGPTNELPQHLEMLGQPAPPNTNVLEHMVELAQAHSDDTKLIDFEASRNRNYNVACHGNSIFETDVSPYANSAGGELGILFHREFLNVKRTPELFFARLGLKIFFSLVIGTLFFDLGTSFSDAQSRLGLCAFASAFEIFTSTDGIASFLIQRQIFIRESTRGAYRPATYAVANFLVYLPFFAILSMVFCVPTWYLVALHDDYSSDEAGHFFFFFFVTWLTLLVANAMVVSIASVMPDVMVATTVSTAAFAQMFLFSGFFIAKNEIPDGWIWFHWISIFKHSISPQVINIFDANKRIFSCPEGSAEGCRLTADDILDESGRGNEDRWEGVWFLIGFILFYRFMFYVGLKYFNTGIRK